MRLLVVSPDSGRLDALRTAASMHKPVSSLSVMEGTLAGSAESPINGATDVLLLDATRETMQELDALEKIQRASPNVQSILLAPSTDSEILLRALRLGVKEVLTPDTIEEGLDSALNRVQVDTHNESMAKTYVFVSAKGGSGGTFLAANFAHKLAEDPDSRVLLIDLDLKGGNAHLILSERKPLVTVAALSREIHRVDKSFLESSMIDIQPNFGILASPEDGVMTNDVRAASIETLLTLARANFDYVVIDIGRTVGPVSIKALDSADLVFPVTQLSVPFIRETRRLGVALKSLDFMPSKIQLIVNRHEKVRNLTIADLEKAASLGEPFLIPNDYRSVSDAINQGLPIAKVSKNSPVNKALNKLVAKVTSESDVQRGWLSRVLSR